METATHKFEQAGLGKAPFRVIGVSEKRGPIRTEMPGGVTMEVGSPGQPMGSCDFCGTGIATCWEIKSADGKRFIVGSDCVLKTGDAGLVHKVESHKREIQRQKRQEAKKRQEERNGKAYDFFHANRELFVSDPHPSIDGKTLGDYYEWMFKYAGRSGTSRIAREIEARMPAN